MVSNRNLLFLGADFQLPCFKLQVFCRIKFSQMMISSRKAVAFVHYWNQKWRKLLMNWSIWYTLQGSMWRRTEHTEHTWVGKFLCRYHHLNIYIYLFDNDMNASNYPWWNDWKQMTTLQMAIIVMLAIEVTMLLLIILKSISRRKKHAKNTYEDWRVTTGFLKCVFFHVRFCQSV